MKLRHRARRLFGAVGAFTSNPLAGIGTATAPAANAVIASAAVVDTGIYSIRAIINLSGTAEPLTTNLRLRSNAVQIVPLPSEPGTTIVELDRATLTGGANVDVQVVGAATAGAIYTVTLLATRIG